MVQYFPVITGSLTVNGNVLITGSINTTAGITGSFSGTATTAQTASSVANLNQNVQITGSLGVTSTITAQTLNVQQVTSSIVYSSGSNVFGNSTSNTQVFTGSLYQNGPTTYFSGNVLINTGSNVGANARLSILNGAAEEGLAIRYLTSSAYSPIAVRNATDDVFQLNQNGRLYVSGTLGVGTSTPTGRLDVQATGTSTFSYYFRNSAGGYGGGVYNTGANNTQLYLATSAGTENVVLSSTGSSYFNGGNVGILNTDPQARLHIGPALFNAADATNGFILKQTSTNETTGIYIERSGERKGYAIYVGGSVDSLVFQRNNAGTKSDVLTLTRDGNVGIGATSGLDYPLYVKDSTYNRYTIRVQSNAANTANGWGGIGFSGEDPNVKAAIMFVSDGNSYSRGSLVFAINNDANQNSVVLADERVRITASGLVKIVTLAGSGTRTVTADASGYLSAASDSSLKQEDITHTVEGLAEILQLTPRAYKWLSDIERRGDEAATEIGFFANEVAPIIPSAAPKSNGGLYGFYDRAIIAALVKSVQELSAKVDQQAAEIEALKAK